MFKAISRTTSKDKAKDWQSKARTKFETRDQGRGQLASRVLEAKAMSLKTPYLMCIKGVLRTEHCLQYCTVHHLFHGKKIMNGGLGGPGTPTPLATPMHTV